MNAGLIMIKAVREIENLSQLEYCHANGGNGMNGQKGGHGDEGRKSTDTIASSTFAMGPAQFIFTQAHIPGEDEFGNSTNETEKSGKGDNAGSAGLGGEGGFSGNIFLEDSTYSLKKPPIDEKQIITAKINNTNQNWSQKIKNNNGERGQNSESDGKGGNGGLPGSIGADMQRIKKGYWRTTLDVKGQFDETIFDDDEPYLKNPDHQWSFYQNCGNCDSSFSISFFISSVRCIRSYVW